MRTIKSNSTTLNWVIHNQIVQSCIGKSGLYLPELVYLSEEYTQESIYCYRLLLNIPYKCQGR